MFKHTKQLAYKVRVDEPNPLFAKMLQQAIGGVEGEIRVCLQYLFQGWGNRGPDRYKDMLLNTGTEEIGHIEMLATAVALNLEGAPASLQEEIAGKNGTVEAVLGGQDPRHVLSAGLAAMPADSNGNPFNGSWVVATGNVGSDMLANVHAEASGRLLARIPEDPARYLGGLNVLGQPLWSPAGPNGFPDSNAAWAAPEGMKLRLDISAQVASRIGETIDPRDLLELIAADAASTETRRTIERAESRQQALALLLMSPEFQRR